MIYHIIPPSNNEVPILISIPHCGTEFPEELKGQYIPEKIETPEDTDWFVDKLYDFASEMGITIITARYSRWVIDLNRSPESKPLYTDGRVITDLVTTTDFLGNPIYKDKFPTEADIDERLEKYYFPYYYKIEDILNDFKERFGKSLLYDAHSIKRFVPGIRKDPFPDMILGDNDGASAHPELIKTALESLSGSNYQVNHNNPFKGGYITRFFGKPAYHQHALQLERVKMNYMDDSETKYDHQRASRMKEVLKKTLENLIHTLMEKI